MSNSSVPQKLSEELLEMILQTEDLIDSLYPTTPNTEFDWTDLDETASLFDDLPEDELSNQAEQFFGDLHQRWQTIDAQNVEAFFIKKYTSLLPSEWLETLLERAKCLLLSEPMESLERLIICVKPLLASWSDEDLQVFARPFVWSMRGFQDLKEITWEERSQIDKGRLTMAIAQEILIQLENQAVRE
ncbi:hypothetical protein C7H19_17115 [Aphanothece hegewaldii CCALA 016]|uniref:Uncharacterized protein n=1 Tax=Aphanothece hegewaldii CCALA 016 TaxID=2107694 RepID=A0A2T1LUN6_9CHRO|nr:hypothetical protein [Aphanothece hegewaldii]PSF35278.1 hypothetical protein C7H19_17115 [Aphanothece hegewaldii CCALA 016]